MSHLTFQTLVDYVDSQLTDSERTGVEQHLATCNECQQALTLAQNFLTSARTPEPSPPQSLVRRAIAAFKRKLDRAEERTAQAVLPSFDSWALAGARGVRGATAERQLLYTIDPFDLDLQISAEGQSRTLLVRGQILAGESEPGELEGIVIRLLRDNEEQALRLTDELGRFAISNLAPGSYTLQVVLEDQDILIEDVLVTS